MAKKQEQDDPNLQPVKVTIVKFGEGKVSTGEHIAGKGDIMAERGDVITVSKNIADALESKGYGEVVAP
ncbi:MAG: hypothetical protein EPO02_13815 [Nitrospirae bacterium]|nr:MAG: hypothetical protein EPO02_13815 [Nitrospirota bacterium]